MELGRPLYLSVSCVLSGKGEIFRFVSKTDVMFEEDLRLCIFLVHTSGILCKLLSLFVDWK